MPEVDCANCGETMNRIPSKIEKNDRHFCSRDCYHDFGRPDMQGENHYDHKGKTELECEQCGDAFKVHNHRKDSARFCSRECKDKSQKPTGENHGRWNGGKPEHECDNCGNTFKRYHRKGKPCVYCSKECYSKALEDRMSGENNPAWRGGWDWYYGDNWEEQREKALDRDDHECQDCGKPAEEMPKSPDIHHKKRLGWFREEYDAPEWWERGNKLDNLVTLCSSCHKKREWKTDQED